jgi:hypothetical protein
LEIIGAGASITGDLEEIAGTTTRLPAPSRGCRRTDEQSPIFARRCRQPFDFARTRASSAGFVHAFSATTRSFAVLLRCCRCHRDDGGKRCGGCRQVEDIVGNDPDIAGNDHSTAQKDATAPVTSRFCLSGTSGCPYVGVVWRHHLDVAGAEPSVASNGAMLS